MKRTWFPDSLVLIFGLIVLAQLFCYILPAGSYEMTKVGDEGHQRDQVVPGSYAVLPESKQPKISPVLFLEAVPRGLNDAADIIFFVFIVGGAIGILRATGATDALIGAALRAFGKNPLLLVSGMVTLFALGSSFIGMAEEYMPFIPLLVTLCLALRMDAVVAMGIVYVGAGVGYGCAALNPFTVLIAQDIADVPAASGQWYRWVLIVPCLIVGIHHILAYARRVQADPAKSLVRDLDYSEGFDMPEDVRFTGRRLIVLLVFVGAVALFVYGVGAHGWYFTELAVVFLALTLLWALLAGLSPNRTAREFIAGAGDLVGAALLIGFARGILAVMNEGMITHTVIHGIASVISDLPAELSAVGMLFVQSLTNFLIPSGSGQAYVTMPIMAPLADLSGVTRQTAVLAYQMGDGFMNMIVPTNALLMGMLALGRIPYQRWFKFVVPLLIKIYLVAIAGIVIAVLIGYGGTPGS